MNARMWLVVLITLAALPQVFAEKTNSSKVVSSRPANWAVPVVRPGLPNCFQLTTNFYRGAQPTKQGMAVLKTMGIKTVINLRSSICLTRSETVSFGNWRRSVAKARQVS